MRNYGRTSIDEFLGERVVYRNLEAADPRLPRLRDLGKFTGLPPGRIPRKTEPAYARAGALLLQEAQRLRGVLQPIRRLIFVGDTRLLDETAFANLCLAGGWSGLAFIGSEDSEPAAVEVQPNEAGRWLYRSNRWAALADFERHAQANDFPVDEATAVVLDIDKTAIGARGRNGQVIDRARKQAVRDTLAELLGDSFDLEAFEAAYELLNRPEFHPFSGDNQDYVAYLCLVLGSRLYSLEGLVNRIRVRSLVSFEHLLAEVEERRNELPVGLAEIHEQVSASVKAGDPTPFKTFRRREYLTTLGYFDCLPEEADPLELLSGEIVITQEVRAAALKWQGSGALSFGFSDKPDEAALPTPEQAAHGWQPLHRAVTHAVGD
jgi:hypothetical protein